MEEKVEVTTAEDPVSNEVAAMKETEAIENMVGDKQEPVQNIPQNKEGIEEEALKEATTIEISDTTATAVDLEKAFKVAAVIDTTAQLPELEEIGAIKNKACAEATEKELGEQVSEAEVEVELIKEAVVKEKICVVLAVKDETAKETLADNKVGKVEACKELSVKDFEDDIVAVQGVETNLTEPGARETEGSEALSETVSTVLTSSQSKGRREKKTAPRARRAKMPGSARPIRSLTATMIVEPQPISKLIEFKHLDTKVKKAIEVANSEGEVDSGNDAGSNSSEDENKARDDTFAYEDYLQDDLAKVHTQNMKAKTKETESEGICVIS